MIRKSMLTAVVGLWPAACANKADTTEPTEAAPVEEELGPASVMAREALGDRRVDMGEMLAGLERELARRDELDEDGGVVELSVAPSDDGMGALKSSSRIKKSSRRSTAYESFSRRELELAIGLLRSAAIEQARIVNGPSDDRVDFAEFRAKMEAELTPWRRQLFAAELEVATSAGLLLYASPSSGGGLELPSAETLAMRIGVCADERFADEPSIGHCSGVLVAPTLVATAAHCIADRGEDELWFVFGYRRDGYAHPSRVVDPSDAFRTEVFEESSDGWALLRLDRAATAHAPAKLRRARSQGFVTKGEWVFAAGHPAGLPLKLTRGGRVKYTSDSIFETDLDLFEGNSGSPIFARGTSGKAELIGLVLDGAPDWEDEESCKVSVHCRDASCGEERAVAVDGLAPYLDR